MKFSDLQSFDPATAIQSTEPMPQGWYKAKIVFQKWDATLSGDGHALRIQWEILGTFSNANNDPKSAHIGRKVTDRLNLDNPKPDTVTIAEERLARIMNSIGVPRLTQGADSLLGKPCLIRLNVIPANDQYPAKNGVRGYRPAEVEAAPELPMQANNGPAAPHLSTF